LSIFFSYQKKRSSVPDYLFGILFLVILTTISYSFYLKKKKSKNEQF